jgi:UDP-N-acetyl-2-amino-2-deoxyglucuronate dehydrogenase
MVNSRLKFAVVGCGHIGKRHATMIQNNPQCELVALCDTRSPEETSADIFEVQYYYDLDKMLLEGPPFDVLCIATPNGLHETHAIKGLKAGRHIVLEKPMALTKSGCERIIYESLHQHRQVFCVMQNRYSPPSVWLKNIISENLLGQVFMVQINCYWNRDERYYTKNNWHGTKELDGGTLFTQFSHFIDIMFWLFGDIENIKTNIRTFNHEDLTEFEDSGNVIFDFVNGGCGVLNFSTSVWDRNLESSITIIAEKGTIKVGGQYMNEVEYCHVKGYEMPVLPPSNPPNDYGVYKGSAANHHFIFDNVVDVLTNSKSITTNALEGLKVVEIIERIYKNQQ